MTFQTMKTAATDKGGTHMSGGKRRDDLLCVWTHMFGLLTALLMIGAVGCGEHTTEATQPIQQGTEIHLSDGVLQGDVDGGARRFLGIPFAAPPVGDLRWRPPQPPLPWEGVRPADTFGSACPQRYYDDQGTPVLDGDEDCLYLNVWTPDPAPTRPLPVMVWFHGGGNQMLSASVQIPFVGGLEFDGRALAETRNVVVVTINYRLGVLGFFGHAALAAEDPHYPYAGNQGLLDQRAALIWVRDNIIAFGGDRDNVTILGESAGSYDVCLHVVSPGSGGLFHRAISESNGCTTHQASPADAAPATAQLVESVGCSASSDVLDCLRQVPVADLLNADPLKDAGGAFNVTIDGGFLPDQPRALFAAGKFNKVPYLLGSNADEGTGIFLDPNLPPITTDEEYLTALSWFYGDLAEQIADVYPVANFASPLHALARAVGDGGNVCLTYDTARRAATGGADVYLYNFARPLPIPGLEFFGATHQTEILYVFGSFDFVTEADRQVALGMQGYWTRMAYSGDPNGEGAVVWPRYGDASDERINFDAQISVLANFRRTECEFWWGVYDQEFK